MSTISVTYNINVGGNAQSAVQGIVDSTSGMNAAMSKSTNIFAGFRGSLVFFQQATQFIQGFSDTIDNAIQPGVKLNASLQDLSAITNVVGEGLKEIEGYARDNAQTFGLDAAQAVESYKLILSQLSPEIAKTPEALKAMGESIAVLSKTMGGDTTAAAEVLTTAMNQFQVSTANPIKASEEMARMMNVMAAAAKEGSAELPQIKQALEQSGMAAKAAGVSFEEANAAIQVLDKAGKKGAEGGVALRNVMNILSRGRFLPKEVLKELSSAGVDIQTLTDKSLSLTDRLRPLQTVLGDSALFSKLFGMENTNAAMALVQGVDEVDRYTIAIKGTNTAYEQAEIVMESYAEKQARIEAKFNDIKISIFNATGDFGIWTQVIAKSLVPLAQITPLIMGVGKGISWIKGLKFASMLQGVSRAVKGASISLAFMKNDLITCNMASLGFQGNIARSALALVRFATIGIFNAIKGIGALILSFITGGTASVTFSTIASGAFSAFSLSAKAACRAITVAIVNIPIVGWIAGAIALIAGVFAYFWKTSAKFRAVIKGLGAVFVAYYKGLWELSKKVFTAIGDLIKAAFSGDGKGIKQALKNLTGGFKDFSKDVGESFTKAYNAEMAKSEKDNKKKAVGKDKETPDAQDLQTIMGSSIIEDQSGGGIDTSLNTSGKKAAGDNKIKTINITIDKVIERFEVKTTTLKESTATIKDMVAEAIIEGVNDVNLSF